MYRGAFLVLIACGRLGFDPGSGGASDVPAICDGRQLTNLPLTDAERPITVRATELSNGYAVAVGTDAANIYMVRVDANGDLVSIHLPFPDGYTLFGISQIQDRPFVYLETSGGGYIKMLDPSWDTYTTGPNAEPIAMDPPVAILPGGTTAMIGLIAGGTMTFDAVDVDGTSQEISPDYAPAAIAGAFAATPTGVRVVVGDPAGGCETFALAPDGTSGPRHHIDSCRDPVLATDGTLSVVVHTTPAGSLAVHEVPADASIVGRSTPLAGTSNGRVTWIDGVPWIGYAAGTGAELVRFVDGVSHVGAAPEVSGPFDLTPSRVFWASGVAVRVGDPCRP